MDLNPAWVTAGCAIAGQVAFGLYNAGKVRAMFDSLLEWKAEAKETIEEYREKIQRHDMAIHEHASRINGLEAESVYRQHRR